MRYPTEAKHGVSGYKNRGQGGLSNPVAPAPRPVVPGRPDLPPELGFVVPGLTPALVPAPTAPLVPIHDPIPGAVRPLLRPGFGRALGPFAAGLATGWALGVLIWGDPFATGGPDTSVGAEGWSNPKWTWNPCGTVLDGQGGGAGKTGILGWHMQTIGSHPHGTFVQCNQVDPAEMPNIYTNPADAVNESFTSPSVGIGLIPLQEITTGPDAGDGISVGVYIPNNYPDNLFDPEPWVQVMLEGPTPGYGTPLTFPESEPELAPIMWPAVPVANPYPATLPDAFEQPSTQPSVRPVAPPTVVPMPPLPPWVPVVVVPPVITTPGGSVVPVQPPTVVVTPAPGGGSDVVITNPSTSPPRTPPGRDTKEQKAKRAIPSVGRGLNWAVNTYTEFNDFVAALYAGVPRDLRKKNCHPYDMYCMLSTLWDVWDDPSYDASAFVAAFLNNQLEDTIFGMIGQLAGKASQNANILTGLNRALNSGSDATREFMEENQIEGVDLLPTLAYDDKTGDWSLQWELFGISMPLPANTRR